MRCGADAGHVAFGVVRGLFEDADVVAGVGEGDAVEEGG